MKIAGILKAAAFIFSALGALVYGLMEYSPPVAQEPQPTQQVSETPAMPTIEPTPTVDAFATYQAQAAQSATLNEQAAKDNLEAASLLADSQNRLAESNERAAQIYAAQKQADNEAAIAIAQLEAEEADARAREKKAQADLVDAETRADAQKQQHIYDWAVLIIAVIMAVLVAFGVVMFFVGIIEQRRKPESNVIGTPLPAYPGGLDVRKFVPSIPADVLLKVARAYVAGVPLTHESMTPGYISEGQMRTLQYLLVRYGGADWKNQSYHTAGCKVNQRGDKFFRDLAALPPPPQERMSAENVSARETDTIRQAENPGGGGEE
jgi:hypothetical protein